MAVIANEIAAETKSKRHGGLKLTLLLLVCAALAGGGAWYYASARQAAADQKAKDTDAEAKAAQAKPLFVSLGAPFVVNLAGDDALRFLQVDVQVLTRDPKVGPAIELLQPELRNRLLLLFGSQTAATLSSRDGKVALQKQALTEIRTALKQFDAPNDVDAVLFTSFVMQ